LPLLYVLNNAKSSERKRILSLIKRKNKNAAVVSELIKMVTEKGGLDYAEHKMNEFKEKAITGLMEFEDCPARISLIELMEYITTRKK
jgi:octaprenyl-diphosphate synthase